ncbi:conserved thioredoxin-like related protein [Cyclospora cayetanensis]|uniref:Conserved thioredoxin-like related protein n=1 Tax=Cyclospora cayetanensis TaxID=88456 RepID=A0A1D3CUN9_9EIME|nr:conserved thioredoxin-like related protein [Cyclospora cayetanensis]
MSKTSKGFGLLTLLELNQCECRNEATPNALLSLLKSQKSDSESPDTPLESGNEDPQLLISLGFSVPVRLTGLRLRAPIGAAKAGEAPRRLRIFFNDPTKSFADAETDPATDEFDVPEGESFEAGINFPLKSVRYKCVASLQVFVADNGGAPVTKISELDVFGTPVDNLQMKDWKPVNSEDAIAQNGI